MIASCVVHSRNRPSRVCGKRSNVRHSTSCRTPPTLIDTRRFVCFACAIMKGSGCIDDNDLLKINRIATMSISNRPNLNESSGKPSVCWSFCCMRNFTWNVLFVMVLDCKLDSNVVVHIVLLFRCQQRNRRWPRQNCCCYCWPHRHSHHRLLILIAYQFDGHEWDERRELSNWNKFNSLRMHVTTSMARKWTCRFRPSSASSSSPYNDGCCQRAR